MGCCSCFGFLSRTQRSLSSVRASHDQDFLLPGTAEDIDSVLYNGEVGSLMRGGDGKLQQHRSSAEILSHRAQSGMICREVPVKETTHITRTEDENGNKMINEYVREWKIGAGSYGKVVLYRSTIDGKRYAIKVSIMKMLAHPNIVNLIEVIDDPDADHFYMVLEYVEGKGVCEGSGPPGGIGESTARRYLRDIVSGLIYLHAHDDNDVLRRSPGTPVFTAPECCLGLTYHGKAADTWALGVTLYCMVLGQYPFLGDTLQDTYDKIVKNPLFLPDAMNPELKDLLDGLLCKDPKQRIALEAVRMHPWVVREEGPIPEYLCRCNRKNFQLVNTMEGKNYASAIPKQSLLN